MRLNDYGLIIKNSLTNRNFQLDSKIKYEPHTSLHLMYQGLFRATVVIGENYCGGCATNAHGGLTTQFKNLTDIRRELYRFLINLLKQSVKDNAPLIKVLEEELINL